jgi:hypothetical protein
VGFAEAAEEAVRRCIHHGPAADGAFLQVTQHFLGGGVIQLAHGQQSQGFGGGMSCGVGWHGKHSNGL